LLDQLDGYHDHIRRHGRIGELKYSPDEIPARKPSDFFARNCWVTASFPSPVEAASRSRIGVDHFMWGSDYPHDESSYPHTREALRRSFAGTDEAELRQVLGGNAAHLYGFDLDALRPLAAVAGPTVAELGEPYTGGAPDGNRSPAFTRP
jgi:hypothetical protein